LYFGTAAKTVDAPRCTLACILFKI
jgi:hypothetical protein